MKPLSPQQTAHVIVDFQNDFVTENGALSVKAEALWWTIRSLIKIFKTQWIKNIASKDWHPKNHSSFASSRWEQPTYTDWSWPDHCVAGTWWADLHWTIDHQPDWIVHKWIDPNKEAYSAFQDTPLGESLQSNNIKTLIITGVATDYCVEATARDAIKEWLRTIIVSDAIKAVNDQQGAEKIEAMKADGIEFVTSENVKQALIAA